MTLVFQEEFKLFWKVIGWKIALSTYEIRWEDLTELDHTKLI